VCDYTRPIGDTTWRKEIKDYDKVKIRTASVGLGGDLAEVGLVV
jgi:hypothetical protein